MFPFVPTLEGAILCNYVEKNGGDDGALTRGLCRDRLGIDVLSATYVLCGGCQVAERDCRNRSLWVNLWVRISRFYWSFALLGLPRDGGCWSLT
jgi:hypothetical protein